VLKRPRLLILSGQAGAGTSSAALGLSESLGGSEVSASVVDGRGHVREIEGLVDRTIAAAGLDTIAQALSRVLAGLAGIAGVLAVHEAAERGESIVWDAGETGGLLRVLALLDSGRRELASILPLSIAMRATRSLSTVDRAAWQGMLTALGSVRAMLDDDGTRVLLVAVPDDGLEEFLAYRIGQLSLMRTACDGILVNRVPRNGDGWPESWAEPRRQRVERLRGRGLPVVDIAHLTNDAPGKTAFWAQAGSVLDVTRMRRPLPDSITERNDGGFDLHMHLPGVRPDLVKAGRLGDSLVTEVAGLRRQTSLAPVLTRCAIQGAGMDGDWLIVRFGRNQALWPEAW
jgi:hypothetical protein